jgi:hypothetical protein
LADSHTSTGCGKYGAGLAAGASRGKLILAEPGEEEQGLERLRRWYRAIRAGHATGQGSKAFGGGW